MLFMTKAPHLKHRGGLRLSPVSPSLSGASELLSASLRSPTRQIPIAPGHLGRLSFRPGLVPCRAHRHEKEQIAEHKADHQACSYDPTCLGGLRASSR